jgi:tetratricopeptide (TPR) repeat protein
VAAKIAVVCGTIANNVRLHGSGALTRFARMSGFTGFRLLCLSVACCVALCGCLPSTQGPLDEQREPHFLTAKARAAALDFKGAIEAYETALEANPRNASAHYELGLLCEREGDYAAAIYHLERYLKFRADAPNAQIIRDRINADKMELSKTAAFAPVTQNLEREFQKLAEEKQQMRAELERTKIELEQWRAYAASRGSSTGAPTGSRTDSGTSTLAGGGQVARPIGSSTGQLAQPVSRTHTVQSGETLTSIASRYRVTVAQLRAANPGLDPRRMKIGQSIRVPGVGN